MKSEMINLCECVHVWRASACVCACQRARVCVCVCARARASVCVCVKTLGSAMDVTFEATARFWDSDIFQEANKMVLRCILSMISHPVFRIQTVTWIHRCPRIE